MAHREFVDPDGVSWEVWDVHPTHVERRRRSGGVPLPEERRVAREGPRVQVRPEFLGGWLAFQSRLERRRLAPAPQGWESMDDEELAELCAQAVPVGTPRRLVE
jgi:hypothetical protein